MSFGTDGDAGTRKKSRLEHEVDDAPMAKCFFTFEDVNEILREGAEYTVNLRAHRALRLAVDGMMRELVAESLEICRSRKRKTLFKDDVLEAATKKGLFFLFDLFSDEKAA